MDDEQFSFLNHLPLTRRAVRYADGRHGGQRRAADGAPFILHLLEVASLLDRSGYPDEIVAAAVLHDTLEDTDASRNQLQAEFGAHVAELVAIVSDDPLIDRVEERKDEVRERVRGADDEAVAVYAADKISKVRELRLLMSRNPDDPQIEIRMNRYRKSLEMLEDQIPGSRLTELLRFELEAIERLPTRIRARVGRLDTAGAHHDHHTLGEIIADSLRKAGIATAEETDAFVEAWWEALDQDRKEAEAEASRR